MRARKRTNHKPVFCLSFCLFFLILITLPSSSLAQLNASDTAKTKEKKESEWPKDSLNRRSPKGTVNGFIKAVAKENYKKAALYLDLRGVKNAKQKGPKLAKALQQLLDNKGQIITEANLSNQYQGNEEDDLAPELEIIGKAIVNKEEFNLLLVKTEGPEGEPVWLFSSETLKRIPKEIKSDEGFHIDKLLPAFLKEYKWFGIPFGHILFMLLLTIAGYIASSLLTLLMIRLIRMGWEKAKTEPTAHIIEAFALPIKLYLTLWIMIRGSQEAGISIILRQKFGILLTIGIIIVFLLLVWRLIDVGATIGKLRMIRRNNYGVLSVILFFRRGSKFVLIIIGIITILDIFGVDVTTGLAALGIGGLALALGAQKSIENFVGSVTLIADQPIRVGDLCKVGDIIGTVEQIGMRSTRIRTLSRTIVTIPNGEFSSMSIENLTHRDRFLFQHTFGLRYETTPEQIRYLLVELRSILYAHSKVSPEPARVRFINLGADSLQVEIFAYVNTRDYSEFLDIQEDLLLRMMDVVEESGSGYAFPSQTVYFAKDKPASEEKVHMAEEKVREWREKGELHIPHFDKEYIDKLKNSIPYPPEGSSDAKENPEEEDEGGN